MTVEFGLTHHFSNLDENSEVCLCSFFEHVKQIQKLTEHFVNYDILF